jgi:GH25 family lysozyme M1 (1,4-beta-N-acetylmuramidase)
MGQGLLTFLVGQRVADPKAHKQATEGTSYIDPKFSSHYTGATNAGLIRGGYHFAHLDSSSGAAQAKYFLAHGGGWSGDGITLPGMLDLEGSCVLSASATVSWIKDFSNTYYSATGVYPLLYTNPSWWSSCTGNSNAFINTNPLVLARYSSSAGTPPGGWPYYTIWQYNDAYKYGGDSDVFNGDEAGLKRLASG